jgi:hypothetical protein
MTEWKEIKDILNVVSLHISSIRRAVISNDLYIADNVILLAPALLW